MSVVSEQSPQSVVSDLQQHVLVDGFRIVIDLKKSRGSKLVDAVSGRELLDLYGFYGSLPLGFNHPHFDRPAVQQDLLEAARTKVANSDVYSVPYANFVNTFSRVAGLPPLERYFFIDGGALAVENALKAAMDWKVRKNLAAGKGERGTEILHFERAFHGRSGYTLSLTNTDPRKTEFFARFPWPRVPAPSINFALPETERDQDAAAREKLSEMRIRQTIAERGDDIAAIIIEPVQGEGGDNHFRAEWFHVLRRICDESDILLIFDEVQTGLGATGRKWCCEHFGVLPDLLVFGKKTQVCGVMAAPRLDEVPENCFRLPGRINSTWGGNLTDMVRATHCLRVIAEEQLVDNAATMGRVFLSRLRQLAAEQPILGAVRGRGLLLAFDLPDTATRDRFYKGLFETGLLAIRCGPKSIRFRPVLDVTAAVIDAAMELLREQCRRLREPLRKAA
ncbi:MAG: L-lysine 6-transaminase [Verrucomicrobia subdivision 3 bacterium]|nr:L-lysine 6-transaminase [Limisphaerales bacterium]